MSRTRTPHTGCNVVLTETFFGYTNAENGCHMLLNHFQMYNLK